MNNRVRALAGNKSNSGKYGPLRFVVNVGLMLLMLTILSLVTAGTSIASAAPIKILMIGDSLTAGLGLDRADTIPVRLQSALADKGFDIEVINAGVSGDTSAGGRARLGWALNDKPNLVIVELGANDGLRGLDPKATFENLDAILTAIGGTKARIILAGMKAPPNLGQEYGADFNGIYPALAEKHSVALMPFFLDGVAAIPELNQDDAIHPNAKGVAIIVDNLLPLVISALGETPK
jgi:acyl-CoA thioesterase-1